MHSSLLQRYALLPEVLSAGFPIFIPSVELYMQTKSDLSLRDIHPEHILVFFALRAIVLFPEAYSASLLMSIL